MSTDTSDTGFTTPGGPVRLDLLTIYGVEQVVADPERYVRGPPVDDGDVVRTYLLGVLHAERADADGLPPVLRLGIYASADGAWTVRAACDERARVGGRIAHSLLEPVDRLRVPAGPEGDGLRAHLSSIVRETHLSWRDDR